MHRANAHTLSDEPETMASASPGDRLACRPLTPSYREQLSLWRNAEDLNAWIAAYFHYDMDRAMALSASRNADPKSFHIYAPSEVYRKKSGMCVDLSRFAVESLREIELGSYPQYLMISFAPIYVHGYLFHRHWLATFIRQGLHYFFADTKRPGLIAGPYKLPEHFLVEYEQFRQRQVLSFRLLPSHRRMLRKRAKKSRAQVNSKSKVQHC